MHFFNITSETLRKMSLSGTPLRQMTSVHFEAQDLCEVVNGGIFTKDEFTKGGGCFKI